MTSKERILTALSGKIPDKVPYMYSLVDSAIQIEILGYTPKNYLFDLNIDPGIVVRPGESSEYRINYLIHPDTAKKLGLDAIGIRFPSPLFVETRLGRSGHNIERGLLRTWDDLRKVKMPDPDDEKPLEEARTFIDHYGENLAVYAAIRLGASPTLMSMGYDGFSYAIYDDIEFAYAVVELYANWTARLVTNLSELGFTFMWAFDDIAFKSGALFSCEIWRDVFLKHLLKVSRRIACPWIFHSDGNLLPILDDLLPLGMSGIHPLEPGTMDLDELKTRYGKRLCLVGNIDINYTLSEGTEQEVDREVAERVAQLGPGGGFILSDSNSVPYFCKAKNIIAMSRALHKYGYIYGETT